MITETNNERDAVTVTPKSILPPDSAGEITGPDWFQRQLFKRLERIEAGQLIVNDSLGSQTFGKRDSGSTDLRGEIEVRRTRFYRRVALSGGLAAAEGYIDGDWDSPNLTEALQVLARNAKALQAVDRGVPALLQPLRAVANLITLNTRRGSRRNIAQHYDLSNEFFALMLDRTMTYSSGIFPSEDATLEEASIEKYDRICRKLQLTPADHVLEIGTGWGGFAEHAASHYGCRVTTTTISQQQHAYAAERFRSLGLTNRITLLEQDYRDLTGEYDKLVSIEMIEAVGQRYLPTFFAACSKLLKPTGAMALQAITIPDYRYDSYRRSVDFIQKHIFPGGFLPSPSAIGDCLRRGTDFSVTHVEDFAPHYARTLAAWRDNLWSQLDRVKQLGIDSKSFDDRFLRIWKYYLAYCKAGFLERQIGVSQWLLTKPAWRAESE